MGQRYAIAPFHDNQRPDALSSSVEHPPGVRGYFVDSTTGKPSNDFYLRPDEVRTLRFVVYDADCARDLEGLDANVLARSMADNLG